MPPTYRDILRIARLGLRPVAAEDASAIIAGVGQLAVSRFLSVVPHPYSAWDFQEFLALACPGFHWTITDAQGFTGVISLAPGFGFWIAPGRQGRGYATEAARAVLAAHFRDPRAGPVTFCYFADNAASAGVHRKLGFTTTAVEDAPCRALGPSRPLVRLHLTRDDWQAHGGVVAPELVLPSRSGPSLA